MSKLFAYHDSDESLQTKHGMFETTKTKAIKLNAEGYGIFRCVNEFSGKRQKSTLTQINAWFVELDSLSKPLQLGMIEGGLIPSMIIESKRGFHVYFNAINATPENWGEIMKRILYYYQGDSNAKDVTRVLRAPGYYHMKDPADPFEVVQVWHKPQVAYSEKVMRYFFPEVPEKPPAVWTPRVLKVSGGTFWQRLYDFDCEEGLRRFSGKYFVNHEIYDFTRKTNGNLNLMVNGKSTSVFLDKHKRIGSGDKGGPTLWQWLKWFGHSNATIRSILESEVPEVFRG